MAVNRKIYGEYLAILLHGIRKISVNRKIYAIELSDISP